MSLMLEKWTSVSVTCFISLSAGKIDVFIMLPVIIDLMVELSCLKNDFNTMYCYITGCNVYLHYKSEKNLFLLVIVLIIYDITVKRGNNRIIMMSFNRV